jgi:hypothetical protein
VTGGIILQKQEDGAWKPVSYFSKIMTPDEHAYLIQDRGLWAVVDTKKMAPHCEPELLGMKFVVIDHQAVVYWSSKHLLSMHQGRWADFLTNFDITFQDRRGQENIATDALSRKTINTPTVHECEAEDRTRYHLTDQSKSIVAIFHCLPRTNMNCDYTQTETST